MEENDIGKVVSDAAVLLHHELGPGLLVTLQSWRLCVRKDSNKAIQADASGTADY